MFHVQLIVGNKQDYNVSSRIAEIRSESGPPKPIFLIYAGDALHCVVDVPESKVNLLDAVSWSKVLTDEMGGRSGGSRDRLKGQGSCKEWNQASLFEAIRRVNEAGNVFNQ